MNRQQWKKYHRAQRVMLRESKKAASDCLLYGTGVMRVPSDGSDPEHINLADMQIEVSPSGEFLKLQLASAYGEFNGCS